MAEYERRAYQECRVQADDSKMIGYAIVFNALSLDLGGFREQIAPDAVDKTLDQGKDVRALADHDSGKVLGRTRSGTLQLRKESRGLKAIIEPDLQISYASDLLRSIKRGDVSGMSFGFRVLEDDWNFDGPIPIRTVLDMDLREVSVVTFPAYEQTSIEAALRSMTAFRAVHPGRNKQWYESRLRLAR